MDTKSTPQKRLLLFDQFTSLFLIFRPLMSFLSPYIYWPILVGLFVGKYIREGNTFGSVLQYVSVVIIGLGDVLGSTILMVVAAVLAILNYIFVAPTLYTLPQYRSQVGFRENYQKRNDKNFYYAEFYPVQQDSPNDNVLYEVPWSHGAEMERTAEALAIESNFGLKLLNFFNSSMQKYKVTFSKAKEAPHRGFILFSHGRTATPSAFTSLFKNLAREWKILSPQHSEVGITPYQEISEIKKYREQEIKRRAEEIVYMASKVLENEEIVLMGHSHGGATVIQAYHALQPSIKKRVSHIVLLDPWLFPLTDQTLNREFACNVIMMANQYFIGMQEIYNRNKKFVEHHGNKIVYLCWKESDHLLHTDLPFVLGISVKYLKNLKDCVRQHELGMKAIHMFLDFKKVGAQESNKIRAQFAAVDLGIQYKPAKFRDHMNL